MDSQYNDTPPLRRLCMPDGPFSQVTLPSVNTVVLSQGRQYNRPFDASCSTFPLYVLMCSFSRQLPTTSEDTAWIKSAKPNWNVHAAPVAGPACANALLWGRALTRLRAVAAVIAAQRGKRECIRCCS